MTDRADTSFGLSAQALAILQLLAQEEPTFADYDDELKRYVIEVDTFPWYNGREKGVALQIQRTLSGRCLVIVFSEKASSNQVTVKHCVLNGAPCNGPCVDNVGEILSHHTVFPQHSYADAIQHILWVMKEFYQMFSGIPLRGV